MYPLTIPLFADTAVPFERMHTLVTFIEALPGRDKIRQEDVEKIPTHQLKELIVVECHRCLPWRSGLSGPRYWLVEYLWTQLRLRERRQWIPWFEELCKRRNGLKESDVKADYSKLPEAYARFALQPKKPKVQKRRKTKPFTFDGITSRRQKKPKP